MRRRHRLDGLEPDNALALLALLGLLRALDEARPEWAARAAWTVGEPPLRALLEVPEGVGPQAVSQGARDGLDALSAMHDAQGHAGIGMTPGEARACLAQARGGPRHGADVWAAMVSDAALSADGKKVQPTPLCLMFGGGRQYFVERVENVAKQRRPPDRECGEETIKISEVRCLNEALFAPWERPDRTFSFRWDHEEDVRHALRARRPTDRETKETTQHGANRLAAVGLAAFPVAARTERARVRLAIAGGTHEADGTWTWRWPIWRTPMRLAAIRALIDHPRLDDPAVRRALGVVEMRRTRKVTSARLINLTRAEPEGDSGRGARAPARSKQRRDADVGSVEIGRSGARAPHRSAGARR